MKKPYKSPVQKEIDSFEASRKKEVKVFKIKKLKELYGKLEKHQQDKFTKLFGDLEKITAEDKVDAGIEICDRTIRNKYKYLTQGG